jgi:hypothetical protein
MPFQSKSCANCKIIRFAVLGYIFLSVGFMLAVFSCTPSHAARTALPEATVDVEHVPFWLHAIVHFPSGVSVYGQDIDGWHPRRYRDKATCTARAQRAAGNPPPEGVTGITWLCSPLPRIGKTEGA